MLLGPTDAIYDNAKAHGRKVRAYGERGRNIITPPTRTWTDIYNDWRNGTRNVNIDARAMIVGLRDIYSPAVSRRHRLVPDVYRADIFLEEFEEFEKNGELPNLDPPLLYTITPPAPARDFRPPARRWRTTTWRSAGSSRPSRRAGTGRSRRSS